MAYKTLTAAKWREELSVRFPAEISARYAALIGNFEKSFGAGKPLALFSAPGRTEIGGNHTDHQHGCVLAASVDLDSIAAVCPNESGWIRIQSEGYPLCTVDTEDLSIREEEKNTTMALIRGVAAKFREKGCAIRGFDAYVTSRVLRGSGLSSSASFEVLVGVILNCLYHGGKTSAVEIAQIGQYAENVYFGKPSGLMDQMACSVGTMVAIDFADPANPVVERVDFDFQKTGYALCIIDSGADHADLTDEYAAIPNELAAICGSFGKKVLRDVPEAEFRAAIPALRKLAGDRAVLRGLHFYGENRRAQCEAEALRRGDFDTFLTLVRQSGRSSWMYLQNVIPAGQVTHQEVAVALGLCDMLLGERGAWRVHGGGFAGTVQAFVPGDMLADFKDGIEAALGEGSCHVLSIRREGGIAL